SPRKCRTRRGDRIGSLLWHCEFHSWLAGRRCSDKRRRYTVVRSPRCSCPVTPTTKQGACQAHRFQERQHRMVLADSSQTSLRVDWSAAMTRFFAKKKPINRCRCWSRQCQRDQDRNIE